MLAPCFGYFLTTSDLDGEIHIASFSAIIFRASLSLEYIQGDRESSILVLNFKNLPRFQSKELEILSMIPHWANTFHVPEAEIERQIGIAHGWIDVNPKKAPKMVMRYLFNWLCIANRKYELLRQPRQNYKEEIPQDPMTGDDWTKMKEALHDSKRSSA